MSDVEFNSLGSNAKLSKSLEFASKPFGLAAKTTECYVQPVNTSYSNVSSATRIQFSIPTNNGAGYIDGQSVYLRGTLVLTNSGATPTIVTTAATTASSAIGSIASALATNNTYEYPYAWIEGAGMHSIIKELKISYNNIPLEQIQNYGDFTNLVFLNGLSPDSAQTKHSFEGMNHNNNNLSFGMFPITATGTVDGTTPTTVTHVCRNMYEFCLKLNSSIFGFNSNKQLPLAVTAPYVVEITFADLSEWLYLPSPISVSTIQSFGEGLPYKITGRSFYGERVGLTNFGTVTTNPTVNQYNINNIYLHYSITEVSPAATKLIKSAALSQGGIILPITGVFSNYETSIAQTGAGMVSKSYDIQYTSVRSIFACFHPATKATTSLYLSCLLESYLNSYQIKVGNTFLTPYAISSDIYNNTLGSTTTGIIQTRSAMQAQLAKAFGNWQLVEDSYLYSNVEYCNQSTTQPGAFCIGETCESDSSGALINGMNTTSLTTTIYLNTYSAFTGVINVYAIYDSFLYFPMVEGDYIGVVKVLT